MIRESTVTILNWQKLVRASDIKFYVTFAFQSGEDYPMDTFFDTLMGWEKKGVYKERDFKSKRTEGWDHGYDMAELNADGSITFGEYFSRTPAVEGLISEVERMYFEPTYSIGTTRPFYLRRLLVALANFWD